MNSRFAAALLLTTLLCSVAARPGAAQTIQAAANSRGLSGVDEGLTKSDCRPASKWIATADVVLMQRARPDSLVLMQDAFDPSRNLNADSLVFDFAPGWDVGLQRATDCGTLEARFLSVDGWDAATQAMVGPPATLVQINNVLPAFQPGVNWVDATYRSELLNGELNLRRRMADWMTILGGFRYLELDEHFHADLDAAAVTTTYDTFTSNRLYGGQVGADALIWCRGDLTVNGLAKVGVFHNSGGQSTVLDSGIVTFTAADTSNRASFLGELAFTANYRLNDSLTVRAGYDMLWLEAVVLASNQVPATNFATGGGIGGGGGTFYHGGFLGLEYVR